MTTLYTNPVRTNNYVEPRWMREERYMYCEPFARTRHELWTRFKNFFL